MWFYRSILKRRWPHKIKASYIYSCGNKRLDDMSLKVNNMIMISPSTTTSHRQISQRYFTSIPHILIRIFLFFHYSLRFMLSYIDAIFINFYRPWGRSKHLPDEILKQSRLLLINLVRTTCDSFHMRLKYTLPAVIFVDARCIYSLIWQTTSYPQSVDLRFTRC